MVRSYFFIGTSYLNVKQRKAEKKRERKRINTHVQSTELEGERKN
jgi:hypothetical protein